MPLPVSSFPVFDPQAVYPLKLASVVRNDNQAAAPGVAGDQQVIGADGIARSLEICTDLTGMERRVGVKIEDLQPLRECLDLLPVLRRPSRLGGAIKQFVEHNA